MASPFRHGNTIKCYDAEGIYMIDLVNGGAISTYVPGSRHAWTGEILVASQRKHLTGAT